MDTVTLGRSDLKVSPICLGTMTFGESQVDEAASHRLLDHALQRGVNFIDTAEMYPVPPSAACYGDTERIIGNWLSRRPGVRSRIVLNRPHIRDYKVEELHRQTIGSKVLQ